jgi:hypothetical protein
MKHLLQLNPRMVLKHFGQYPERGKALPCLPKKRVTVGWKQLPFGRGMVPDDNVMVLRRVALLHVKADIWQVVCEEAYWPIVKQWLLENCHLQPKPKSRRRRSFNDPKVKGDDSWMKIGRF